MSVPVKQNSLKAWILAARPKTLAGAVAPVFVGAAIGFIVLGCGSTSMMYNGLVPFILCSMFALLMQIDANFINDYFDFKKGADKTGRLGPERACTQGWITPGAMKAGIAATTIVACLVGLPLIYYGGWTMLLVGIFCVLGAFLYTTKLSYQGLGDLMVVFFFGIIPVVITFHVLCYRSLLPSIEIDYTGTATGMFYIVWGGMALLAGTAVGLVVNNLLIINNYRDREQDAANGKNTLVVTLGAKVAEWLYLINGIAGVVIMIIVGRWVKIFDVVPESFWTTFPYHLVIPLLFLPFVFSTHRKMIRINRGKELNALLGETSRNILIYSLLFIITIFLSNVGVWCNG